MKSLSRGMTLVAAGGAAIALAGGTATAASLITAQQLDTGAATHRVIKDGAVQSSDLADGAVGQSNLSDFVQNKLNQVGPTGSQGVQGPQGNQGPQGPKGVSGLEGTIYRVAHYTIAGQGAIASVACQDDNVDSVNYVAIAGGVQFINADGDSDQTNDPDPTIADSFPGRMDYSTPGAFVPKPGRLDGWVVRLGSAVTDSAPHGVNVWAICVPRPADVTSQTTDY